MNRIKLIFWNPTQNRFRFVWRFSLFIVAATIVSFLTSALEIALLAIVQIAMGRIQFDPGRSIEDWATIVTDTTGLSQGAYLVMMILTTSVITSGTILLAVWLSGRLLDRRHFIDFGFRLNRNWWADFGFGLALGALLMAGVFLWELAAGWITITGYTQSSIPNTGFVTGFLHMLSLFIAVGFYEELMFRGYLLKNMAESLNSKWINSRWAIILATLISSGLFGFAHASNPNATLISSLNITLAGILLATGFILTGELAIPIGLHITWNLFQGNIFGFPVSGTDAGASFITIQQGGPELWTGGNFGPEAGITGLVAMLIGMALIVLWVKMRQGRVTLHSGVATPALRHASTNAPQMQAEVADAAQPAT